MANLHLRVCVCLRHSVCVCVCVCVSGWVLVGKAYVSVCARCLCVLTGNQFSKII